MSARSRSGDESAQKLDYDPTVLATYNEFCRVFGKMEAFAKGGANGNAVVSSLGECQLNVDETLLVPVRGFLQIGCKAVLCELIAQLHSECDFRFDVPRTPNGSGGGMSSVSGVFIVPLEVGRLFLADKRPWWKRTLLPLLRPSSLIFLAVLLVVALAALDLVRYGWPTDCLSQQQQQQGKSHWQQLWCLLEGQLRAWQQQQTPL